MEDNSSTKEAWSFHEIIRAILRCLGLETYEVQQNPSSPKKEDDDEVNSNQPGCRDEVAADPPSTVPDPAADPPSTTSGDDSGGLVVSLSTPTRPGTSSGTGPQIN